MKYSPNVWNLTCINRTPIYSEHNSWPQGGSLYKQILLLLINVSFDQIGKKNLCNRVVCDNDIKFILYIYRSAGILWFCFIKSSKLNRLSTADAVRIIE